VENMVRIIGNESNSYKSGELGFNTYCAVVVSTTPTKNNGPKKGRKVFL